MCSTVGFKYLNVRFIIGSERVNSSSEKTFVKSTIFSFSSTFILAYESMFIGSCRPNFHFSLFKLQEAVKFLLLLKIVKAARFEVTYLPQEQTTLCFSKYINRFFAYTSYSLLFRQNERFFVKTIRLGAMCFAFIYRMEELTFSVYK